MNHPDPDQEPQNSYRSWPGSDPNSMPVRRTPVTTNPALSVLRIVLWLLPTIVVPFVIFCVLFIVNKLNTYALNGIICFVSSVCSVAAIGYFDQRILLVQKQLEYTREKDRVNGRVGIFVICQIFIIPILWFTLLYGFCIITESGY
jgi:hypothetical protein